MSVVAALPAFGHNERSVRLGLLADDAKHALKRVERGESEAIEGWLAYGAALNEGRALFPSDEQFGQWLVSSKLEDTTHPAERSAAMWAAANPEQFAEARAAGNARTVRGIHAKWKEIQAEREAEAEAEKRRGESEAKRKEAEAARAREEAARHEAEARAQAEAEARRAAEEANAEDERQAAIARADAEAEARRRAQEEAEAAEHEARQAEKLAEEAEQSSRKGGNYRANGTGENEWYTPEEYIALAREVMGGIDLDPASCAEANETVGATVFHTQEDNGLEKDWSGRVWLNPPYSRDLMPAFCEKLAAHVDAGEVTQAILVSHNNTDTGWFHRLARSCRAVCFPKRRIRFYRGDDVAAPVNGQVFFYFGDDARRFADVFGSVGAVLVPHE